MLGRNQVSGAQMAAKLRMMKMRTTTKVVTRMMMQARKRMARVKGIQRMSLRPVERGGVEMMMTMTLGKRRKRMTMRKM